MWMDLRWTLSFDFPEKFSTHVVLAWSRVFADELKDSSPCPCSSQGAICIAVFACDVPYISDITLTEFRTVSGGVS